MTTLILAPPAPAKARIKRAPRNLFPSIEEGLYEGAADGIDGGGWRDRADTPCAIARDAPPGWPDMPAWIARELRLGAPPPATAAQISYLRRLGIADRPRDKAEASEWIEQALEWKRRVP